MAKSRKQKAYDRTLKREKAKTAKLRRKLANTRKRIASKFAKLAKQRGAPGRANGNRKTKTGGGG